MDIDALHKLTLAETDEASVTVNQRSLIDKILSRYSSENTLLRELIQNADDADAQSVVISYESIVEPASGFPEDLNKRLTRRLTVKNDGQKFRSEDWMRLARIAEGNPTDGRIGAYGVGFYAVFSLCDEPFIVSGDQSLAMYWRNDQLFTRKAKLPVDDDWTTFSLNMREPVEIPQLKDLTRFLANALTFSRSVSRIELRLDSTLLCTLKRVASPASEVSTKGLTTVTQDKYLQITKVESASVQITATYENITQAVQKQGMGRLFGFLKETPKPVSGSSTSNIFLRVMTAHLSSSLSTNFAKELQRATKKQPPKQTKVQLVSMNRAEHEASTPAAIFENLQAYPGQGRIYIGFPTHQTTGFSGHVGAPCLIPTVERESIDLVDRFVKLWNFEVLRAVGLLARVAYHHEFASVKTEADATFVTTYFSIKSATPLKVDAPIEDSFFGSSTTLPLYTASGVKPSTQVRLPDPSITFLKAVPVLPLVMAKQPFIQKIAQLGMIEHISIGDIRQDLRDRVLSLEEGIRFLMYCSNQSARMDREALQTLLSAAIIGAPTASFNAGAITSWSNAKTIPVEAPLPPTTVPSSVSQKLSADVLTSLGWSELRMLTWIEHCAAKEPFGRPPPIENDPQIAALVLATFSKNFDLMNPVDKAEVVRLLQQRSCMPTRNHGLRTPGSTYFVHSKMFDDLPLIQVKGVKDKVLAALGVRRTIELDLIFNRLVSGGAWSAYDLVQYLASVRNDIPREDIKRLHDAKIAESETSTTKFRATDLYEPNDTLRKLGLPIIKWPVDKWKSTTEEAILLYSLGLRKYPKLDTLMSTVGTTKDAALYERTLRYMVANFAVHGYGADYTWNSAQPFLPSISNKRLHPRQVFVEPAAALFGFEVLRRDLVPSAALFGVRPLPLVHELLESIGTHPSKDLNIVTRQFELLASLSVQHGDVKKWADKPFIPTAKGFASPDHCFFRSEKIEPWLGEVFELVDFGPQANLFLRTMGVRDQPSTVQIAGMLVNDAQHIFTLCGSESRYKLLLLKIARELETIKRDGHLFRSLQQRSILVAHKYKTGDQDDLILTSLRAANEIVIADDFTAFNMFKADVYSCPQDSYLEEFYISLGCVRLSSIVQDQAFRTGSPLVNDMTKGLRAVILERVTIFFANNSSSKSSRSIEWLSKHLQVATSEKVWMQRTLVSQGKRIARTKIVTAIVDGTSGIIISGSPENFDIAVALCRLVIERPKQADSLMLESLLSNSLESLKARGFNVNRILQRQEALKREREEQQRILSEQDKVAEAEARDPVLEQSSQEQMAPAARQQGSRQLTPQSAPAPVPSGFFSTIRKGLGYSQPKPELPPPIYEQENTGQAQVLPKPLQTNPVQPVQSQASIDVALNKAIRATRSSDEPSVFSRPQTNTVSEAKTYCDAKPATDLVILSTLNNGLKLFITRGLDGDLIFGGELANAAAKFSVMLERLARCFGCNASAINLFYDQAGSTIAFNKAGTIYCNLRYFHQLGHATHADGKSYWYVTLAHEIAHNLVAEHSSAHEFYTESLVVAQLRKLIVYMEEP
ncbi:hypothetical protein BCR37DRAFT_349993 [Protomyces lactucae-debilis]|uniref:Sacsin/Nov domain-containing protein n=1 Tax=Protomyces lactucae-debilis TaxID=2754530 RepID=A0A1Y2F5B7_PROLT|nr:uncharacterized protein BCR37DRAFT_349993 [Protomyces lactucae-debilis]ORY79100.1 hypothetical protein BCR37DRAFT_349993 [Protomyces lactucae-debilis]